MESKPIELINIQPLNTAIIQLMEQRGLTLLEQVGLLDMIKHDLIQDVRDADE